MYIQNNIFLEDCIPIFPANLNTFEQQQKSAVEWVLFWRPITYN